MSIHRSLCVAAALFLFSFGVRAYEIRDSAPVSDERLWVSRAERVVDRLQASPSTATSHIGHPGVPPAILMAAALAAGERIQGYLGAAEARLLTPLTRCRLGIAAGSSVIPPVIFLGFAGLVGAGPAFLAALFAVVEPHLLANSRIAHLDAMLALFVLCSFILYVKALGSEPESLRLKLAAGFFWGLALATKPTSVALVPCFMIYRAVLRLRGRTITWLSWSDVGAVLVGHAVLISIFTRLWFHDSDYRIRLGVDSSVADALFGAGLWFRSHPIGFAFAVAVSVVLAARGVRGRRTRSGFHLAVVASGVAGLLVALIAIPQVLENLARFWTWVFGLSTIEHTTFVTNRPVASNPSSYFRKVFTHLPGTLSAGLLLYLVPLRRTFSSWKRASEGCVAVVLMILTVVVWMGLLETSTKQSWRYALPVVPLLFVVAAVGWFEFSKILPRLARTPALTAVVVTVAASSIQSMPNYFLYRSAVTGGLAGSIARGETAPHFAPRELVAFVRARQRVKGPQWVNVVGDNGVFDLATRHFQPDRGSGIMFGHRAVELADLELYPAFGDRPLPPGQPVFSYGVNGIELMRLYEVPPQRLDEPLSIPIDDRFRTRGVRRGEEGDIVLVSYRMRIASGRYRFTVSFGISPAAPPEARLVELRLSSQCFKEFLVRELESGSAILECSIPRDRQIAPSLVWRGGASARVKSVELARVSDVSSMPRNARASSSEDGSATGVS